MLYILRTILAHLQEQLLYAVHRIWFMPIRLAVVWHKNFVYLVGLYTDVITFKKCHVLLHMWGSGFDLRKKGRLF